MPENQVKISYKPLWKLLIDRNMTKTELRKRTKDCTKYIYKDE